MIIDLKTKQELENIYQRFLHDDRILRMKEIPMHRGSNCYLHSFKVAKLAVKRALKKKNADLKTILISSILHDYYLYDWRIEKDKKLFHCATHPAVAVNNATRDFNIDDNVKESILTHMWPWNLFRFPSTKEARILTMADKFTYLKEIITSKKHKQKRKEIELNQISFLFD